MKSLTFLTLMALTPLSTSCGQSIATSTRDQSCQGCRNTYGECLDGMTAAACGLNGEACVACPSSSACQNGTCAPRAVQWNAGGGGGGAGTSGDAGRDDGCSNEARLVYVVEQDRTLSSFDPALMSTPAGPFLELGQLSCRAEVGAEPFSMAVDRNATAWIIYDSGELFTVNVRQSPLVCVKTSFAPQLSVTKFGMGFVSDAAGSKSETLYISGSDIGSSLATTKFGTLGTVPPYAVTVLGSLRGAPELTGTGDAKLWAFFPNVLPPKVARLSKTNGAIESAFEAPALAGVPRAWAFAFWGGDFYIFLERSSDTSTGVWKMNGHTGALTLALEGTGRRIVGAGVSTCAPVQIN